MPDWKDEYLAMIKDCKVRADKLSEWENQFIFSVEAQLQGTGKITAKQVDKLNDIWEKVTDRG